MYVGTSTHAFETAIVPRTAEGLFVGKPLTAEQMSKETTRQQSSEIII